MDDKIRVLFIENRRTTEVFHGLASYLLQRGLEIYFLVQNHAYAPEAPTGRVFKIAYPKKSELEKGLVDPHFYDFKDRAVTYFGGDTSHYPYYRQQISAVLDRVRPDVLIGETTLFHELIALRVADQKGIPYLHPVPTRMPADRLTFYIGKTMEVTAGKGAGSQRTRPATADNDSNQRNVLVNKRLHALNFQYGVEAFRHLLSWLRGERFNTPSPIRKIYLNGLLLVRRLIWNFRAAKDLKALVKQKVVLYPLQMQPETNIDIWGADFSDQRKLIEKLAELAGQHGFSLAVKINPHCKYEILNLNHIHRLPNTCLVRSSVCMEECLSVADLVVSVTGSVILECANLGINVISLGDHALSRVPGVRMIADMAQLNAFFSTEWWHAPKNDAANMNAYFESVALSSYEGIWFDPLSMPEHFTDANLSDIAEAFFDVVAAQIDVKN